MLTRKPTWQGALNAFLNAHRSDKFAYGKWDCCLFAADAILAITDADIAADFRGKYSTRKRSLEVIEEITGVASVRAAAEYCADKFGMKPIPALMCGRGDMVLIERPRDWSLGIVALDGIHVAVVTRGGIEFIPLSQAARGWRV